MAELTSQLEQLQQQLAQSEELRQQGARQLHDEQQRCVAYEVSQPAVTIQHQCCQPGFQSLGMPPRFVDKIDTMASTMYASFEFH